MQITIRFFAAARDLAACESAQLEINSGSTVADLRGRLAVEFPALVPMLKHSMIAVNLQYVGDGAVLVDGVEVAMIPPVSGG